MEQARKFRAEIERKREVVKTTDSWKLKRDYTKSIYRDEKELRRYCKAKGIDMPL